MADPREFWNHRYAMPGWAYGTEPHSLHDMVMLTVEKPLLDVVMRQAEGNQSKAAEWLGINRNTLRRKLVEHKLIK